MDSKALMVWSRVAIVSGVVASLTTVWTTLQSRLLDHVATTLGGAATLLISRWWCGAKLYVLAQDHPSVFADCRVFVEHLMREELQKGSSKMRLRDAFAPKEFVTSTRPSAPGSDPSQDTFVVAGNPRASRAFRYRGHWMWVETGAPELPPPSRNVIMDKAAAAAPPPVGSVICGAWNVDADVFCQLMVDAQQHCAAIRRGMLSRAIFAYRVSFGTSGYMGVNQSAEHPPRRTRDTACYTDALLDDLLADVTRFFNGRDRMARRCVPYRRGYLFHGEPGCGKTTLIHMLATELGLTIFTLSLRAPGISIDAVLGFMHNLPNRAMLVLEDFDGLARERKHNGENDFQTERAVVAAMTRGLGFSDLLRILEGVNSTSNNAVITVVTANHIDHLDPAMIRPGRIDVVREIKPMGREQIAKMFRRFFPDTDNLIERSVAFANIFPADQTIHGAQLEQMLEYIDIDDVDKAFVVAHEFCNKTK